MNVRLVTTLVLGVMGAVWAGTPKTVHFVEGSKSATIVSPVDLDADGDMDLLCTLNRGGGSGNNEVYVLSRKKAPGEFKVRQVGLVDGTGFAGSLRAGDVDGDGDLDVIGVAPLRGLYWFENKGGAKAFSQPNRITTSASEHLAVGDFDGDGDLDAMTGGDTPGLHLNADGKGGKWTSSTPFPRVSGLTSIWVYSPDACDIDGDGDLDVVCSDGYGLCKLVNDDGIWKNERLWAGASSEKFGGVQARDFDGDGDVDVVAAARQQAVYLENLDGKGAFSAEVATLEFSIHFVDAGDIDGDGDVDVVAATRDTAKVAWLAWDGDEEEFVANVLSHDDYLNSNGHGIRLVDMDGDKDLDVLFNSANKNVVRGVGWLETR